MRDDTKHATEVEGATRKLVQATSEAEADTHLTEKEALTDAFSNNESNTICIRQDPAKEKMVFSKESSRAIFEMAMWSSLS